MWGERQESEIAHMQLVGWSVGLRISAQSDDPWQSCG